MTCALLAARVSATKPGMPGSVQTSGVTRHETAIQRKQAWWRKSEAIGPGPACQRSQACVPSRPSPAA